MVSRHQRMTVNRASREVVPRRGAAERAHARGRAAALVVAAAVVVAGALLPSVAAQAKPKGTPGQTPGTLAATTKIGPGLVPGDDPVHHVKVVAQALPTECFRGIGVKPGPLVKGLCVRGGVPRTMYNYAWGFTMDQSHQNLWFGAATGGLCANTVGEAAFLQAAHLNFLPPFNSRYTTCEFGSAWVTRQNPSIGLFGDSRLPFVYEYNVKTGRLTDRTPYGSPLWMKVSGFRSAGADGGGMFTGSDGGVVFMGGLENGGNLATGQGGSLALFAFRESDGAFLGAKVYQNYNNVKVMNVIDGHLYIGVGLAKAQPPASGPLPTYGQVWKWTGSLQHPFRFQVVAGMSNQPTYLDKFEGRLVASAWAAGPYKPTLHGAFQQAAGLWISPLLSQRPNGLLPGDADKWRRVYGQEQFFPDIISADTKGNGCGLAHLDGWEYFGNCDFPGGAALTYLAVHPNLRPKTAEGFLRLYRKIETGGALFRARNLGKPDQQVQVLYGEKDYWTVNAQGQLVRKENLLHQTPLFGHSGFGIPLNYYIGWGMTTFQHKIYMGGVDLTLVARTVALNPTTKVLSTILGQRVSPAALLADRRALPPKSLDGAPVWYIDNVNKPAKPLTNTGFNNFEQWGVRDFFPVSNKTMFMATQGGMNYPPAPGAVPLGRPGWQLLKYTP